MDFSRSIEAYMHHCHSRKLRPKTMLSYEQTLKLFGVWLADTTAVTRVEDIKEKHIRTYIVELQERGKYTQVADRKAQKYNCPQNRRDYCAKISNTTINNYIRNLKAYFAWLVEMEMLTVSPLRRVKPLPEERKPKEYMDDDEVKRLLKCMDKSYYAEYRDMMAIMLMLDAGTRLSETLTIEVEALDLSEQTVVLPADKTKGRKERTVFFSDRTAKELRRWLQFKDRYCESPYLLPVKSTGRVVCLCDFEKNFRKYVLRAGIKKKVSPHTLRNNFARRCLMAGMDIYTLSRILGHSSVTVTEKAYLDIADKELMTKYRRFSPIENIYHQNG